MHLAQHFRKEWAARTIYERFELCILTFLLFFISVLALWATWLAVQEIAQDLTQDKVSLQNVALQEAFGSILTVLILLEFNHSIVLAIQQRSGAIQVRIVVLIAILALARKLILLDYRSASGEMLLGLGGLALALGALYWLIADSDRRRRVGKMSSNDAKIT
jgi:uncharacterized membrane protein (DUF373 family)